MGDTDMTSEVIRVSRPVGVRGQVVIPKIIREKLDLPEKSAIIDFVVYSNGNVEIRKDKVKKK